MPRRTFLFLQGVSSPFFGRLADRLAADGHRIRRINFNCGDAAYWAGRPAWNFRDALAELPRYVAERCAAGGVTDIVLFGDRRPVHEPAIRLGAELGLKVHVFEEGYFRPWWVTLERGGVNARSPLPRDPQWYRRVGAALPERTRDVPFSQGLAGRAWHDAAYHLAGLANPILFPRYRTHWPYNAAIEYFGYARRFPLMALRARAQRAAIERLLHGGAPFFLLPLQLDSDAQLRFDSPFGSMRQAIEGIMRSFAAGAPSSARLVVKNHPLDTGLVDYAGIVGRLTRELGLAARVEYVEGGDLEALLDHARGVVTINSTVGAAALARNRPTLALGSPIYRMNGLTYEGPLDDFWRDAPPPDAELFRRFRKVVMHAAQVHGGFYSREAIALAVENSSRTLQADRPPLETLT
jgi:capsular polysaccharide export protein